MAVSATPPQDRKPALWRRRWFIITAAILLLLFIVGLTGDPEQSSDEPQGKATPTVTSTAAPDPAQEARAQAAEYVGQGRYFAAVAVLEDADLADAANRVRRRGAHALYRQARRALRDGRYKRARRVAVAARRLRRTAAITALIGTANAGLARERAEAIERRRLARIARDERTCASSEKATVQAGAGVPAGCTAYAAGLQARREQEALEQQQQQEEEASSCAPGYSPCLPPYPPDIDCADTGGEVSVSGSDPHGLDADNDGVACGGD
jgi:hypothetical protein